MKKLLPLLVLSLVLFVSCGKKDKSSAVPISDYQEYISYYSPSPHSIVDPIVVQLAQTLEQFDREQSLPSSYLKISPSVKGDLEIDDKLVRFTPSETLKPDTEYKISLLLHEFYDDLPNDLRNFDFSIRTLPSNFKITLDNLQSHSKEYQYVEGTLEASDFITRPEALKEVVKASQEGKNLKVKWNQLEEQSKYYRFTIDSIRRAKEDGHIDISWNGKAIQSDQKGEETMEIPGLDNFKVMDVRTQNAPKAALSINFSDPLDPNQNFAGLVKIENITNLKYEVEGNVLYVYPSEKANGDLKLTIYPGIKNKEGFSLKNEYSQSIAFEEIKPGLEWISKGVILPESQSTPLYFKAVNLQAVDVRVIKIYENNILGFLQENRLSSTDDYGIRQFGKRVAKKTIPLELSESDQGIWKAHAIQLSDFFKADPGALYRVELSFKKAYSTYPCEGQSEPANLKDILAENEEDRASDEREERYWNNETYDWRIRTYDWEHREDPCYDVYYEPHHFITTNVLGSNLGFIAKRGTDNSYLFFTTHLLHAKPEPGAEVKLYNYQKQVIEVLKTNSNGEAHYNGKEKVSFAIAQKDNNYAYADLQSQRALSLSKFDVSGAQLQKGLKGFIYTDRGVFRPGDDIHLTFVLEDNENPLPKDVPVKLEVKDIRGKLVQREVLSSQDNHPQSKSLNRFYYFKIPTQQTDETGNWTATVKVGGASFNRILKIATVKPNRLKIKLDFDKEILEAQSPIAGTMTGSWLHGAPARDLKAEMEVTLSQNTQPFPKYSDYIFNDPVRNFYETTLPVFSSKLSSEGKLPFSKSIKIDSKAPGMLKATFLTKLFEGGGDFSIDVYSKDLAPFTHFVGLKSPKAHEYGSFYTDEKNTFDLISLNSQGEVAPNRSLKVQIFRIEWRWWWNRGNDRLSRYEDASVHRPYKDLVVQTDAQGKGYFSVNIPDDDRGRYLIRIIDENSGHATGRTVYFYKNWWDDDIRNPEDAEMLVFSADKEKYKVGETANISFPSGSDGYALVSIENGTRVLSTQWKPTQKGETSISLPITEEMAPNIFINISLLQPHHQTKNDLPIRLYGVIPIKVENPNTLLEPELQLPESLKPEESFTVKVSEKNKKAMTYTLAMVDEGLLDLTRFATPDIHSAFYTHQALGVKTFDLFDQVIGAYSGSISNIYEIGGDQAIDHSKKNKANRFKPVVQYLGPFYLKEGETQSHQIQMPNYIGSVRTMIIAGDVQKAAYGNAEKTTPVKKPLMVLASIPRKLSPGENLSMPVTVFAMEQKVKDVQIKVETSDALVPLEGNTKKIHFDQPDEQIVNFNFKVNPTQDIQKIKVHVSGNGEQASYEVELDVENPNEHSHRITNYEVAKKSENTFDYSAFGEPDTRLVKLEVSTLPPLNFTRRLQYLIHYPHGCIEQTTSGGFPQLFLDEIFDLSSKDQTATQNNIKSVLRRLGEVQMTNGGLPFWPGGREASSWATTYAGHFALEAKERGYALPLSFLGNWIQYQQSAARRWNLRDYHYNSTLDQAYRLYTLALAGHPELSAMNRLRESQQLTNEAKWRLAAAYALAGKKDVAQKIIGTAEIKTLAHSDQIYSYGSVVRNQAMILETLVLMEDSRQNQMAEAIAKNLNSDRWMSTQETSYSLLAIAKMVRKNGGKDLDFSIEQNGKTTKVKTSKTLSSQILESQGNQNSFKITNHSENNLFVNLYQEGKPSIGEEIADQSNLSIKTAFFNKNGEVMDVTKLLQGTEIEAEVSITNTSLSHVNDIALTQIFPSGWEIINTSFTDLIAGASGDANYSDIRDDRVHFYFDLNPSQTKIFKVKLNTSYIGKYYLPGIYAEAMYDHSYYIQTKGQWVEIEP